ncbi:hypothetical protein BN1013_01962 [Candidatus Rubidus massiliensis]|nr:hypothetical protein BN1013_01962 [Candidatus Rubidus massiliensis]
MTFSSLKTTILSSNSQELTIMPPSLLETSTIELPDYQPNLDLRQEQDLIVHRQKGQLRLCLKHLSKQEISSRDVFNSQLSSLQEQKVAFEKFTANFSSTSLLPMNTDSQYTKTSHFDIALQKVKETASTAIVKVMDEVRDVADSIDQTEQYVSNATITVAAFINSKYQQACKTSEEHESFCRKLEELSSETFLLASKYLEKSFVSIEGRFPLPLSSTKEKITPITHILEQFLKKGKSQAQIQLELNFSICPDKTNRFLQDSAKIAFFAMPIKSPFKLISNSTSTLAKTQASIAKESSKLTLIKMERAKIEKEFLDRISQLPSIPRTNLFPKNLRNFQHNCKCFLFSKHYLKIRPDIKGNLRGTLLYKDVGDGVLFTIQRSKSSLPLHIKKQTSGRHYDDFLYTATTNLSKTERVTIMLEAMQYFAKKNGYKKLFITWDPEFHSLKESVLVNGFKILRKDEFIADAKRTFALIELGL